MNCGGIPQNKEVIMEPYQVVGYYLCEPVAAPEWLRGVGTQILSVSGCIGEQHPKRECFLGGWRRGEQQDYEARLRLTGERRVEFYAAANHLFDCRAIDIDGRFLRSSDALAFREAWLSAIDCRVVSVSTLPCYAETLMAEWRGSRSHGLLSGDTALGEPIGCDILGWDIAGFHSFLCNALQEGLTGARFHAWGLLANGFRDAIDFAGQTAGLGEPVEWLPFRLGAL